ncbi:hypothetical protein BKA82DRAFT_1006423 [Pisolithus tinctorius]|uniref:Uncharacterized protein n=1 Tax=Pisolithus tinctorius Marx 270 TaxID=870435 RepID=A0A0C3JH49_PISTI|nr:hypothetical protein BKA82DRAFT_1006423 [Pisolithus tinctorius]KIN96931.1 hypothetical protein M404DRAFT_1006423 [Pisolithus tinctorius Marx 270]
MRFRETTPCGYEESAHRGQLCARRCMTHVDGARANVFTCTTAYRRPNEDASEANLSIQEFPYLLWASSPLALSVEAEKPLACEIPDFPDGCTRAWYVVIRACC